VKEEKLPSPRSFFGRWTSHIDLHECMVSESSAGSETGERHLLHTHLTAGRREELPLIGLSRISSSQSTDCACPPQRLQQIPSHFPSR
jgi:hypothetical protein